MSKIPSNKVAQLIFIVSGLTLITLSLVAQIDYFSLSSEVILIFGAPYSAALIIYLFYLGVMALFAGKYPHDRAILIFSSEQKSGLAARFSGFLTILFACYLMTIFVEIAMSIT